MQRIDIAIAELDTLIREEALKSRACQQCHVGCVHLQRPDQHGCNWRVSVVHGTGAADCLLALLPRLLPLRRRYRLVPG